jgi:Branched-chain amino acid aminotransferase/4-amino-4-deoxychorismate lyase
LYDGLIYLQITRGVAERDFKFPKKTRPSFVMIAKSIPLDYYKNSFNKGIKVRTIKDLRWKRVDIKTINLLAPVLAKQEAAVHNCQEAWLIDSEGFITEGSSSTAWILKKNILYTTPLSNSILNGITRQTLIKGLKKYKLRLIEKKFNINSIKEADEAFITSATQYVMPVVSVDKFKIGNGKVGKYANIFRKAYMEAIKLS